MKRVFTFLVVIVAPTLALAQATVVFSDNETELVHQRMSFSEATLVPVPPGAGHVELLTAPNGTACTPLLTVCSFGSSPNFRSMTEFLAANPGWAAIAITAIGPEAGRFSGGTLTLQSTIAGGATAQYVLIGWTGNYILDEVLVPNIGHSVRLDSINQFGPTDAWFTLDTVTLTNRSQLYFDTSAQGQPERLYRLVPSP